MRLGYFRPQDSNDVKDEEEAQEQFEHSGAVQDPEFHLQIVRTETAFKLNYEL